MSVPFCRRCGAAMVWIKTLKGSAMPCDPEIIAGDGRVTLVMENGAVVSRARAEISGRVPHWATCPDAARFKKKEKKT